MEKKYILFLIALVLAICFLTLAVNKEFISNIWSQNEKGSNIEDNYVRKDVNVSNETNEENNENEINDNNGNDDIVSIIPMNYIYFENNSVKLIDNQLNKRKLMDDYIKAVYEDEISYYALSNEYLYIINKVTLNITKYDHNLNELEFEDGHTLTYVSEMIVINNRIYLYGVHGRRDDTYYLIEEHSELFCLSFQDDKYQLESKVSEHIVDIYYYDNMIYYISYNETDVKIKLSRIDLLSDTITILYEERVEINNKEIFVLRDISDDSIVYEIIAETGEEKYDEELGFSYTEVESHFYLFDLKHNEKTMVPLVSNIRDIEPTSYESIIIDNSFSYNRGKEILSSTHLGGLKIETVDGYELSEYDLLVINGLVNDFGIVALDITNCSFQNATIPIYAFANVKLYHLLPFTGDSNQIITFDTIEKGAFWGLHTFGRELLIPSNIKNIAPDAFLDRTSEKVLFRNPKNYPNEYIVYDYKDE